MTMHLERGLTMTRTTRRKKKELTPKEVQEYTRQWKAHNKDCRRRYIHSAQIDTLEEYIKYVNGGVKVTLPKTTTISKPKTEQRKNTIPSHAHTHTGALSKPEKKEYSGERKLVGIATMHKSNMVPVFEDEDGSARKEATELAHMRR